MFGFDWTGDGKESLIDDLITLDVLGLLDDEDESDEEDEDDEDDEDNEDDWCSSRASHS